MTMKNVVILSGYCGLDEPTLYEMFSDADDHLLNRVVNNPEHVGPTAAVPNWSTANLQSPPPAAWQYNLIWKKHYPSNDQDFFIRTMYEHSY